MKSVTPDMLYRQSILKYSARHGVTQSAIKYRKSRQYIYFWRRRWDGTVQSLAEKSHKPHGHPNQHTAAELKLIKDMRRKNAHYGLVFFWIKLRQRGYERSITGLYRVLVREGWMATKPPPNPKKYRPKPYEQMQYPGQRVQVDVKYVPIKCSVTGERYYQYTAIDEYSRYRVLGAFRELSTYSSAEFVDMLIAKFPFPIECIQTDNAPEFTNRFSSDKLSFCEKKLQHEGIKHKLIRPYTPRHNGKVERSHRKDNEYFYAVRTFHSFKDFAIQLARHNRWYNNFPMVPLGFKSPKEMLEIFTKGVTYH
jgi:transposase InsO family protein